MHFGGVDPLNPEPRIPLTISSLLVSRVSSPTELHNIPVLRFRGLGFRGHLMQSEVRRIADVVIPLARAQGSRGSRAVSIATSIMRVVYGDSYRIHITTCPQEDGTWT